VVALALGVHGCICISDFSGLDDAVPGRGGAGGEGGAGSGGLGGSGAADGGVPAGGDGGALAVGGGGAGGAGGVRDCKAAIETCTRTDECCAPLQCAMTTAGTVCCGMAGEACVTNGGEDCCGWLNCISDAGGVCNAPPCHCG